MSEMLLTKWDIDHKSEYMRDVSIMFIYNAHGNIVDIHCFPINTSQQCRMVLV